MGRPPGERRNPSNRAIRHMSAGYPYARDITGYFKRRPRRKSRGIARNALGLCALHDPAGRDCPVCAGEEADGFLGIHTKKNGADLAET